MDRCCCEDAPLCHKGLANTGDFFILVSILLLFFQPAYFFPSSPEFILVPYAPGCLPGQTPYTVQSPAPQLGRDWKVAASSLLKALLLIWGRPGLGQRE